MEYDYDSLVDDSFVNECDQIRSIAKKSWLNSASVSLAHLDNVKAKVYNVGLADPKDLKATNLGDKTNRNYSELPANPPLSTLSLQQTAAIGSNNSIPELLRQHSSERLQKPTRPASASIRKTRPPSGKKPRPQSAKEPLPNSNSDASPFGVKGAKYDPSGRPPKGIPSNTTTGWVGPPAGLKYPDRPPSGQGWKLEFLKENHNVRETPPPPPQGTPIPPSESPLSLEQEEKTKRIFELYIGDPYKTDENNDDDLLEDSESDFGSLSPVEQTSAPVLLRRPTPESLRLSLPSADEEEEVDEMDTDRLLAEAEMVTKKLDLQQVFKLNKTNLPGSSTNQISTKPSAESTSQNQTSLPVGSTNLKTSAPAIGTNGYKLFVNISSPVQDSDHDKEALTDVKMEGNMSAVTDDDENVSFTDEQEEDYFNDSNMEQDLDISVNDNQCISESQNEKKGIIHDHREKSALEHVKFSEEKNVTVDITPRNQGRKVTELMPPKKKKSQNNCFVDLIEVKSRIEPVLQAGSVKISPRKVAPPTRPPSGKLRSAKNIQSQKLAVNDKKQLGNVDQSGSTAGNKELRAVSPTGCLKSHTGTVSRPRSAPLNRAVTPITTVTVDYGEDTKETSKQGKDEKTKLDTKPKKRRTKSREDVVTMMQKIGLSEDLINEPLESLLRDNNKNVNDDDDSVISDDHFARFDSNTGILTATVCKSEPERNYYEIARHSSMSNKDEVKMEDSSQLFKTTKTIEFDELEPKEMSVKSVIDPLLISTKEKDKFLSPAVEIGEARRGRTPLRPSSATVTRKPPLPVEVEGREPSLERPGSRRGFVAMTPDKSPGEKTEQRKKPHRPASAPSGRPPSQQKNKDSKPKTKTPEPDGQKELTPKEKEEREKVIDNLLERTKTLLGDKEESSQEVNTDKKKGRPASASIGILRARDQRCTKRTTLRRPASAVTVKTTSHRHTSSSKTPPRKSSGKKRTVVTEPCIINTNTSFDTDATEEDVLCKDMEKNLVDKGVNIRAETLQRALYPPTGRTKYYRITADLPRSNSLTLLSHPKVWLPEEYKKLQKAEKTLAQANEIMYLQHKAELRRAKLAEMGPEEQKKKKKKGKKGGKKLRRSNSFG